MLIEIVVLLVSLAILTKTSSIVVENSIKLSNFFKISSMAIGFLLVATATTLPELSVSIISSAMGDGAIAAGNVFGSNIANILVILGTGAFLYGLKIGKKELTDIVIILVLTTIISAYIIFNSYIGKNALGRLEGIILILLFGAYIWYIFSKKKVDGIDGEYISKKNALYAFIYFCIAILIVLISASFVVSSVVNIAKFFGIAESAIGATIIAFGTSLPEFSICLQAIRKKQYGLALGDVLGANIINMTLILGIAAMINPISIILPVFIAALLFAIVANIALFYAAVVNGQLQRLGGALFLLIYGIYLITIVYLQISQIQ